MPNFVWIGIGMWVQELQELPTLVILPGYVWLYIVVYANHDEIWHAKVHHKTRICMPILAQIGDAGGYSSPKDANLVKTRFSAVFRGFSPLPFSFSFFRTSFSFPCLPLHVIAFPALFHPLLPLPHPSLPFPFPPFAPIHFPIHFLIFPSCPFLSLPSFPSFPFPLFCRSNGGGVLPRFCGD